MQEAREQMSSADRTVMLEIAGAWLACANNTEKTATGKAAEKPKIDDQTPGELLVGEGAPGLSLTGGGGHA
jgi:hypothetical protein